jgi:hypothetical protein
VLEAQSVHLPLARQRVNEAGRLAWKAKQPGEFWRVCLDEHRALVVDRNQDRPLVVVAELEQRRELLRFGVG